MRTTLFSQSGAATGTIAGNAAADTLTGTSGNDLIGGAGGADTMTGGAGDDTYIVTDAGAKVVEAYGGGVDTVSSSVTLCAFQLCRESDAHRFGGYQRHG